MLSKYKKLGMEKSNKSLLWEYFEKLPDGSGRCKTCKKQIACTSGNTTGLGRHLTSFHGNLNKVLIYLCILNISFSSRISRKWNPFLFLFSKVENHLKNFSFSSRTLRNEIPFSFSSRNWRIFFQISLSLLDWTFLPLVAQCCWHSWHCDLL